jgi:hypothetical protein
MDKNKNSTLIKYPDVGVLLDVISSRMREILREKLVGLYLYGSLVAGDFDYEISDIDLLAATATVIDDNEFNLLERMQKRIVRDNRKWENRIEIQYAPLIALKTFKTGKSRIANISPGEPLHFLEAGNDWLLNWYFVRENSITLFGAPPASIIEPVSKKEFIEAVREQAAERGKNIERARYSRPFQAYLIMTVCRALYAVKNGEQVSKRKASSWAKKLFPKYFSLIENAFEWRANSRDKNVDHEATFPTTKEFVSFVIQQINK